MKNVTAQIAHKNADKRFKDTQRFFMKRIEKISKDGNSSATFNPKDYQMHLEKLIAWIEELGFVCNKESDDCIRIVW